MMVHETTDMGEDDRAGPEERSTVALFAGDAGSLSFDQRRCLVSLLKNRYLSRLTHPELWDVLISNQELLQARLNDLFLTLHLDPKGEVAYKRQAISDSTSTRLPTMLHDTAYSREETILLVYLRERMQRERAAGDEPILVDREDLLEGASEFLPADTSDLAGAGKRVESAIDSLRKMGVLHETPDHDRLTISPVLDSLMPLTRLQELLEQLRSGDTADVRESPDDHIDEDQSYEGEPDA